MCVLQKVFVLMELTRPKGGDVTWLAKISGCSWVMACRTQGLIPCHTPSRSPEPTCRVAPTMLRSLRQRKPPPAPKLQDLVAFSVVGNKRNGKYYLPHCSGYSQINLENRVEFASQLRQKRQGIDGQEIVHELLLELVHATTHQRQSHGGLRGWC